MMKNITAHINAAALNEDANGIGTTLNNRQSMGVTTPKKKQAVVVIQ